ncbi:MAG: hypothetical protein LBI70_00200 [Rickettsiales bacterium]|jgi:hypothetical protein|nr:hypothetical protein [Rickettsiales bacterium]
MINFKSVFNGKRLGNLWNKITYFMGNFWPQILVLFSIAAVLSLKYTYDRTFRSSEMTKFVKNSRHAGNAIFINKGFLLTNYKSLATICKTTKSDQSIRVFIIFNGEAIKVDIVETDREANLTLLKIDPSERYYINVNNFALFPNVSGSNYEYMNSNVFISKMVNNPDSSFYDHYVITGISEGGYSVKSLDVFRKNFGEAVLDERLELIGLTDGNTASNKLKFFNNEIRIIEQGRIKNFLKKHNIRYYKNIKNANLRDLQNYSGDINVELICYIKEAIPQRVIKRYR